MKAADAFQESRRERASFDRVRRADEAYAAQLRKIARQVGDLVRGFGGIGPMQIPEMYDALRRYADLIGPWARTAAARMIVDVSRRDEKVWASIAREMAVGFRQEIRSAPTGQLFRDLQLEQVGLITSLPLKAAERVHALALKAREDGTRAEEMAREILRTGDVTVSRANMIARTEVGRVATNLTQARAVYVGSTHFIWETSRDSDVRPTHRKLQGKVFRWDDPPVCEADGVTRALPGAIWNCRCYPSPVLSDTK